MLDDEDQLINKSDTPIPALAPKVDNQLETNKMPQAGTVPNEDTVQVDVEGKPEPTTVLSADTPEPTTVLSENTPEPTTVLSAAHEPTTRMPAPAADTVVETSPTTLIPAVVETPSLLSQNFEDANEDAQAVPVDYLDRIEPMAVMPLMSPASAVSSPPQKKIKPVRLIALLGAIFIIFSLLIAYLTYAAELWGGHHLPTVVGTTQQAATNQLERAGYMVSVEFEASDDSTGIVQQMIPAAGTRVTDGSKVTLVVTQARVIPQVIGLTLKEAQAKLNEVGAGNYNLSYEASSEPEGTVTAVDPAEGKSFKSQDTITLTIAQPYTVPYIIGKTEKDAQAALDAAGLGVTFAYVESDKTPGTVVSTSPEQGTRVNKGDKVTVNISSEYPQDIYHLGSYFACPPQKLATFLGEQKFWLNSSYLNEEGRLEAVYKSSASGTIIFSSTPFYPAGTAARAGGGGLTSNSRFDGVRLELAAADVKKHVNGLDSASVSALMKLCGLLGQVESCNQDTINVPAGTVDVGVKFICTSGRMDAYAWTVLIWQDGSAYQAAVTYAPTSLYEKYTLADYGGRVSDLVAYADLYTR